MKSGSQSTATIDPYYTSGEFFSTSKGWRDAAFKTEEMSRLLRQYTAEFKTRIERVADVGCGRGDTTKLLPVAFDKLGFDVVVHGYDIHLQLDANMNTDSVEFFNLDFCSIALEQPYDLVVLFDVIEHVLEPIEFLKSIGSRTRLVCLHIPLDDSVLGWIRNLPRRNLKRPGHLVVLSAASSLNLLTFAGLRVHAFNFTPGFRAPSGSASLAQKLLWPMRWLLFLISPYFLQRLLGGVSLMVVAQTPLGISTRNHAQPDVS